MAEQGTRYTADVQVTITVEIVDNGEDTIVDQVMDAVWMIDLSPYDCDARIVGDIKEVA